MIVVDQDIPSELLDGYRTALSVARIWKEITSLQRRYPWRLPRSQGDGIFTLDPDVGPDVTLAQFQHRAKFKRCCDCYNLQDPTHDILDPPWGPKSRGYWYDQADSSGLWYYDYFIQQTINVYLGDDTPDWCKVPCLKTSYVEERSPNTNFRFSDFIWCMNQTTQLRMVGLVKKDHPIANVVGIYVTGVDISGAGVRSIDVDVYEVTEDWNHDTVTWNTKPAKGKYLSTLTLTRDGYPWPQWEEIPVDVDVFGLYLIPRDTDPLKEAYAITFKSVVEADESLRPYLGT